MLEEIKTEPTLTPDEVIARQRNRQLMIMTVVIVVLSGLVYLASSGAGEEEPLTEIMLVGGTREEPGIKPEQVLSIRIWKGGGTPLELVRSGEDWRVPSRFDAPANSDEVKSMLTRIIEAARLSRPSTTSAEQYVIYSLNDEDAVQVSLVGQGAATLLQFMIGRSENGSRDFVRLVGPGAPEGIFELTGLGGSFDTLYSTLNLDSEGTPNAKRWVDTSSFEPLPFVAVANEITIRDGERSATFTRKAGSDPAANEWQLTAPRKGDADGAAVQSVIDTLQNYHASDIAGRDSDAVNLGVANASKEITIKYTDGLESRTSRLYFGNTNESNEVAVWLKTQDRGGYIWWAGNFVLARLFRQTPEFMHNVRLTPVPDGTMADSINVVDGAFTLRLVRDGSGIAATWKIELPWPNDAERLQVSNLLTGLSTLQGYPVSEGVDKAALELGPGVSTRVISATYADGTGAGVKTTVLYFGKTSQGEVPVMRVLDEVEVIYWIRQDSISNLFESPTAYIKLSDVNLLARGKNPDEVRIQNGDTVLTLTLPDVAGQKQWKIVEPWDAIADQREGDNLGRTLQDLRGIKLTEPLDKEKFKLGAGLSVKRIDLRLGDGEAPKTVQLFFGELKDEMQTALILREGAEEFWLFGVDDFYQCFLAPADYKPLPTFSGKVLHILLSWKGRDPELTPKDPERTKAQAWALANELMGKAAAGEDFNKLQLAHNEDDTDPTAVFDVNPTAQWVKPFLRLSSQLKVGEVGICESMYGYHVIKRIE